MIKALIVEDERQGLNNLKNLLQSHCPDVVVIAEAQSVEQGLRLFKEHDIKPDVAFLDIQLPDGTVFELLDELRKLQKIKFEIIFVTAFDNYAVTACKYSSIGYLVKPLDPVDLVASVELARSGNSRFIEQRLDQFNYYFNQTNAFEKFSIPSTDGIYFVNIKDIIRCEAEDNYTHFHLKGNEKITASKTIKSYEQLLSDFNFFRVHKSHMINLNFMRKFVKGDGGYLIMDDGKKIEVSRRRRPLFMEKMRRLQEKR